MPMPPLPEHDGVTEEQVQDYFRRRQAPRDPNLLGVVGYVAPTCGVLEGVACFMVCRPPRNPRGLHGEGDGAQAAENP